VADFRRLVPPAPTPGPESKGHREEVRRFLDESKRNGRWISRPDAWLTGWDVDFSADLAARGWVGMAIPVEYGGHGRTALDRYVVVEELLAAGAPVAAHWFADRQIAPALLQHGTDFLKRKYLPRIASGAFSFALGLSEPDAGSDLASLRTRAVRVDGGWILTGTKLWSSGAHRCQAIAVLARSESFDPKRRHGGLSQFIVDLPADGVTVNPIRLLTGAHHFNEVVFNEVFVPDTQLLGTPGNGWHQVTAELAWERSGPERFLSSYPMLRALAEVARGADSDPHLRIVVGGLIARLWTLRQLALGVVGELTQGRAPVESAALVKDLGTSFEQDIVDAALSATDLEGDPTGEGIARTLADSVLQSPGFTLRGGTNEILRAMVARSMGLR